MSVPDPVIHALSERALLVVFAETSSRATTEAMLAFDHALLRLGKDSIIETMLALRSVLVLFDPLDHDPEAIEALCQQALEALRAGITPERGIGCTFRLPVVYGGASGPDLEDAAGRAGLSVDDFIARHADCLHDVASLGFAPGLAYLTGLPKEFAIPRNPTASKPVPAGSLLVANRQTVLTATPIPTGWNRIARTPVIGFRPAAARPCLLAPGDRVSFAPITEAEAAAWPPETPWRTFEIAGT